MHEREVPESPAPGLFQTWLRLFLFCSAILACGQVVTSIILEASGKDVSCFLGGSSFLGLEMSQVSPETLLLQLEPTPHAMGTVQRDT